MEVTPRFTKWITLLAVALSVMDAAAQGSPPAPPRELTAAVTGSMVVLTWDWHPAPDPAQSFNRGFILEAGSGPGRADLAVMALGVDHTLVVHDVSPGVYYVRTRVRGESAISHPSNEVRVVVGPGGECGTPPREVAWFHARASSGGAAFLWDRPVDGCPPVYYSLRLGSEPGLSDMGEIRALRAFSLDAPAASGDVLCAAAWPERCRRRTRVV